MIQNDVYSFFDVYSNVYLIIIGSVVETCHGTDMDILFLFVLNKWLLIQFYIKISSIVNCDKDNTIV